MSAGRTVTRHPRSARSLGEWAFTPKSYARTWKRSWPTAGTSYGSLVETPHARSSPSITGWAEIRAITSWTGWSAGAIAPRMAPRLRMWRVSARVSMSAIPVMPFSLRYPSSEPSERQFDGRRAASRTMKPATRGSGDSRSSRFTP